MGLSAPGCLCCSAAPPHRPATFDRPATFERMLALVGLLPEGNRSLRLLPGRSLDAGR